MVEAILSRWLPLWFGFLVLGVPFTYYLSEPFTVALVQILALLFAALLASSSLAHQGDRFSRWIYRITLAWLIVTGVSAYFSVDPSISIPVYCKLIGLVLVALGVRYGIANPAARNALLFSIGAAALVHGWIGAAEYVQGTPMPPTWVDPAMKDIIKTRSASTFTDPNVFGAYLASLLPFILAGLFSAAESYLFMALWTLCFFACGMALFMTFSRGAYMAACAGLLVLTLIMKPSWGLTTKKQFAIIAVTILMIAFFTGPYKYRLFSMIQSSDMTLSQRNLISKSLIKALPSIPIFGFGLHTFSQVYPRFRTVGGDYPMNAHNEFLQTWVESGPFAAALLLALSLLLLNQIISLIRSAERPTWFVGASSAAFTVFLIHNLSGFSSRILPTAILLAISVGGMLSGMGRPDLAPPLLIPRDRSRRVVLLLILIFVLLTFKNLHIQLLLKDAGDALSANEIMGAESSLVSIERVDPSNAVAQYMLARVDETYGRLESADHRLAQAIAINPGEALFWLARAKLARRFRKTDFQHYMEEAIRLDPAAEAIRLEYARMLSADGKPREALNQLDEALRYSPGFHDVYRTYLDVESLRNKLVSSSPINDSLPTEGSKKP
ncbi:MAG: O-antigen ligase family protein [Candidatus Riflebacteria bacterium]|nr:O-antigen ligase family protein [Candidatus Riflebacteria bacterium]